ncbi:MAG: thioredoxin family protein [bacterium]
MGWLDWEAGLARAQADKKPILLLVYADWCPRCRELTPVFSDPEVLALSKKLVMVRQNSDARPAFLEKFDSLGGYVPRLFFLTPDGSLREDIGSGHPRYPYFYTPGQIDALKAAMRAAVES